ncbi:MAG: uracil-DNA glycosylase [Rhodospirillales bacterium]|jgi:uracil-DNA glycosylase|nr:uracil-DNA glycosylase [Rhodospirillales bacterium]
MERKLPPKKVLEWYLEAGVDEAIGDVPVDRFAVPEPAEAPEPVPEKETPPPAPAVTAAPTAPAVGADGASGDARKAAAAAQSIDELRAALESFEGCGLKKTATNLVFGDGNAKSDIIFIGEAPGAEEDRKGVPFVGPSGILLDRMLASIGLDRTKVFISNTVFWRPPGNRNPTTGEMAVCMPFVERMIELVDPKIVVAVGGPAANSLLGQKASVGKLRGKWFTYSSAGLTQPLEATAIYHPAYLLRTPAQKRAAWQDLLDIRAKLLSLGLSTA